MFSFFNPSSSRRFRAIFFCLAVTFALASPASPGAAVDVMGFTPGMAATQVSSALARLRGENYAMTYVVQGSVAAQKRIGELYYKTGGGKVTGDNLVLLKLESETISVVYRSEYFDTQKPPLESTLLQSIANKYGIANIINSSQSKRGFGWGHSPKGVVPMLNCLDSKVDPAFHNTGTIQILYQARGRDDHTDIKIFDPRKIRTNPDGSSYCSYGFLFGTDGHGSDIGNIVTSYSLTAMDLSQLARNHMDGKQAQERKLQSQKIEVEKTAPKGKF